MKTFKLVDIAVQIIVSIWLLIVYQVDGMGFIYWLMLIGLLHVIGVLVHLIATKRRQRTVSRRAYEVAVPIVLAIVWLKLDFVLYIGPMMAAWYFITCLTETLRYYRHPRPTFF